MHGLAPNTFSSLIWSNHRVPDDVDLIEDSKILKVVAEGTGVPITRVIATTLPAYKDNLLENSEYGPYPWVMPIDFTPRNRLFGLQYCPQCLSEDKEPYFRRKWRLAFVIFCEKHFAPLLDSCAHCGSCITSLARRASARQNQIVLCPSCNVDLRASPASPISPEVNAEVAFLKYLEEILRKGWVEITESGPVYSQLYFKVLHGLMNLLSTNSSAPSISKDLCQYYNIPQIIISLPERAPSLERLRVIDRRGLLYMIQLLLNEWPSNFIKFWERHKLRNYNLFVSEFSQYSSQNDIPLGIIYFTKERERAIITRKAVSS